MSAPAPDLSGRSLLGVFAHPDDESLACGGLLAACADAGARTALFCLTRGQHGPGGEAATLGEMRAGELRAAARVLGVEEVVLLEHEDGMLPWLDAARLEADVVAAIRRLRPNVVVTFDEDGLYGHPDHVAVHERVTAAVTALGDAAPALCFVSMPAGAMRAVVDAAGSTGVGATAFGVDADAFGAGAPAPTLVLDVGGRAAARKLAALRCHRSQLAGGALERVPAAEAERLLSVEHYRRAPVGARGELFFERLGAAVGAQG